MSNALHKKSFEHLAKLFEQFRLKREFRKLRVKERLPWHRRIEIKTGVNPLLCRRCKVAIMILQDIVPPVLLVKVFNSGP